MTEVGLACGEVPWERHLIACIDAHPDLSVARRFVDVAGMLEAARMGTLPPLLVVSPALRGFEERAMRTLRASSAHLLVLLDTVLPPWLAGSDLERRPVEGLRWDDLAEELSRCSATQEAPDDVATGRLLAFAGVSGGVGTSSLCWAVAAARPGALALDLAPRPSLAFAGGRDGSVAALESLLQGGSTDERLFGRAAASVEPLDATTVRDCLQEARRRNPLVLVDAGPLPTDTALTVAGAADHVIVVCEGSALGLARLPGALQLLAPAACSVVVNRVRASATGSAHGATAIRGMVRRACGLEPVLVPDDPARFDRAWLRSDWADVVRALPDLAAGAVTQPGVAVDG